MSVSHRLVTLLAFVVVAGLAAPSSAEERTATIDGVVYYLIDDNGTETAPGPRLVPVARRLAAATPASDAMEYLLSPPSRAERRAGISSAVPRRTNLLGISVSGGVATVDLSSRFASGGGTLSMTARLAQVVWTLTQFPTVDEVNFEIEGKPTTVFGGEGLIVESPTGREDMESLLPAILVEGPAYGAAIGRPVRVIGVARTFESTFMAEVRTRRGRSLGMAVVTYVASDSGQYGTFNFTLNYRTSKTWRGILEVWEVSPMNGRPINVRTHPVTLAVPGS